MSLANQAPRTIRTPQVFGTEDLAIHSTSVSVGPAHITLASRAALHLVEPDRLVGTALTIDHAGLAEPALPVRRIGCCLKRVASAEHHRAARTNNGAPWANQMVGENAASGMDRTVSPATNVTG